MKELYYIYNLNLVAYLRLHGLQPKEIKINDKTAKIVFYFENTPKLHELIEIFKSDHIIQQFLKYLREIRNQCNQFKQSV